MTINTLKPWDCLVSSGSAVLEQWSKSSSEEPCLVSSGCFQTRFPPSQANLPFEQARTLLPMGPKQSPLLLPFFLWPRARASPWAPTLFSALPRHSGIQELEPALCAGLGTRSGSWGPQTVGRHTGLHPSSEQPGISVNSQIPLQNRNNSAFY